MSDAPVIVNAKKISFEEHPFMVIGLCNNCEWQFKTIAFGNVFWFEGSLSPWNSASKVMLGDIEYFCISNETHFSKEALTPEECQDIIIKCTQQMALKIKKFNAFSSQEK